MKVTTDGCLFGAWTALNIKQSAFDIHRILDIGTGTGLLSLMLAQKYAVQIDAVEIDTAAACEAKNNFESSTWKDTLTIYKTAIQQFESKRYDCILTNPPFFDGDLKSDNAKRNLALHSSALSLQDLLANITRLLLPTGRFAILLPYHRLAYFEDLALTNGYYLHKKTLVQQTPKHAFFRAMLVFGFDKKEAIINSIIIKANNIYTTEFAGLLKDYYLQF